MILIFIISSIVFAYVVFCIIREMVCTIQEKDDLEHMKAHLGILFYLLAFSVVFLIWFFYRSGFPTGFSIKKVDFDFGLFLIILSQLSTSITRHFRKERAGIDFILNYKKECKRIIKKIR